VGLLAVVLALVVAGLPVLVVLLRWLPARLAFAREHRAAVALRADVELWALRAALHRPLTELAASARTPSAAGAAASPAPPTPSPPSSAAPSASAGSRPRHPPVPGDQALRAPGARSGRPAERARRA
jgi:hypothetical protein